MSLIKKIQQYNQTGTVFGSISKSNFQNMDIMVPPIELIKKFQATEKPIDDRIICQPITNQHSRKSTQYLIAKSDEW